MKYYAVKSIDNKECNRIFYTWEDCASCVTGHRAVYKSFETEEEAQLFFTEAPVTVQEFTKSNSAPNEELAKKYPHTLRAVFNYPIFSNADNSYCAYQYVIMENNLKLSSQRIVCVGAYLPNYKDIQFELNGEWVNGKRGYQFHVSDFSEVLESKEQIIKYLSCGIFKGVQIKTANKLYEAFGDDVFMYIENDPDEVAKVTKIGKKKAYALCETYEANKQAREIIQYLGQYGISVKKANTVFRKYGINAISVAKEHPYYLCDIDGITFDTADRIAMKENLPLDSIERMDYCAKHVLKQAELIGHLGLDKEEFGKSMLTKLNTPLITPAKVLEYTIQSIQDRKLKYEVVKRNGKAFYYIMLPYVYELEVSIANNLYRVYEEKNKINSEVTRERIEEIAQNIGIVLDEHQMNAVMKSLTNNISVITGGAGTGKTTIIRVVAEYIKEYTNLDMAFLAPTGRASRRIKESTGYEASTIHSYLKIYDKSLSLDTLEIKENTFICIDEHSMTDTYVMNILMNAVGSGCKLVFVGDKNQLPSVGAGAVLKDMIESDVLPVSYLTKIYRQNGQSKICTNAEKIKQGNINFVYDDTFKLFDVNGLPTIQDVMIEEVISKINKYGIDNVACLSPYKEYEAGVNKMNALLQARLNPPDNVKAEHKVGSSIFRENDRVMNLRNSEDVSNGDIGTIQNIGKNSDDEVCIYVDFCGKIVEYTSENMDALTLAYCSTYHKSQGGEYDAVVLCLSKFHKPMLKRNLFYTGVTRAKKEISIVGELNAFQTATLNEEDKGRNTLLWYHLRRLFGGWISL